MSGAVRWSFPVFETELVKRNGTDYLIPSTVQVFIAFDSNAPGKNSIDLTESYVEVIGNLPDKWGGTQKGQARMTYTLPWHKDEEVPHWLPGDVEDSIPWWLNVEGVNLSSSLTH